MNWTVVLIYQEDARYFSKSAAFQITFGRQGEYIILHIDNSEITIKLTVTEGDQAKLGIGAPDEVKLLRKELLHDIANKDKSANLQNSRTSNKTGVG